MTSTAFDPEKKEQENQKQEKQKEKQKEIQKEKRRKENGTPFRRTLLPPSKPPMLDPTFAGPPFLLTPLRQTPNFVLFCFLKCFLVWHSEICGQVCSPLRAPPFGPPPLGPLGAPTFAGLGPTTFGPPQFRHVWPEKRFGPKAVGQKRSLFLALFQMRSGPKAVASDGGASLTSSDGPSDVTVQYFAHSYFWRRFGELFWRPRQCKFEDRLFAVMSPCCPSPRDAEVRHLRGSSQQQERNLVRDARRACFSAKVTRRVFVELPDQDRRSSGSQQCGMLRKSLCGTRDAAHDWERELGGFLKNCQARASTPKRHEESPLRSG